MKTIVHLIDTGGSGGAESLFVQLVSNFQSDGMHNVAVVGREGWLAEKIRAVDITPVVLPGKGSLNAAYLGRVVRLLRCERADLLVTHLYGPAVYGSIAGVLTRTPVLSVLHGQTDVTEGGRFASLKAGAVRYGANRCVFVSQQLRTDIASRLQLADARCLVIQNGIDLERFRPGRRFFLRQQLGMGPDDVLVGSVGNIRPAKAYDVLLDAARIVCDGSKRVHFVIVGEGSGPLYESIRDQRERLHLIDRVHMLGHRSDVDELLADFDVFVLSSHTEGFSLACVEAMACGIAVIATRSGGPEDIITHGESGLLVTPGSAAELAAAITTLLNETDFRMALADGGRRRAISSFSADQMLTEYRDLVAELTGE